MSLLRIPLKLIPDLNPPVGSSWRITRGRSAGSGWKSNQTAGRKFIYASWYEKHPIDLTGGLKLYPPRIFMDNFHWWYRKWRAAKDRSNPNPWWGRQSEVPEIWPCPVSDHSIFTEGKWEESNLKTLSESLKLELTRVEGVANVNVSGSLKDEVVIELNQQSWRNMA